jgi:thiosulfate dehydrogenase [quinone] large subunit
MTTTRESFVSANMAAWPIFLLRIYAGVIFAIHGWGKVSREGGFGDGMVGFLQSNAEKAYDFYWPLVEQFVLPNKDLVASLIGWGELLLGVALVLGLATRFAALGGMFLMLNFWFVKGATFLTATNYDAVWLMIFLVLAFLPAGQIWGLDRRLSYRLGILR